MFKNVIETDKLGFKQSHFYLTQGDTITIYSYPKSNGELIDFNLIKSCKFKISDSGYNQIFEKPLTKDTDKFVLTLTSEETKSLDVDEYIYEFEYEFNDGTINTPNQWKFSILDQIIN